MADNFTFVGPLVHDSNDVEIITGSVDPSAGGGVAAPEGSIYQRDTATAGQVYIKIGAADTAWDQVLTAGSASTEDGYQNTFMGKSGLGSETPTYTGGQGSGLASGTNLEQAIDTIDQYIGAAPTPNTRTNNPIVGASDVNVNIEALDDAIGADADVSSTVHITVNSTLMKKASDLDAALNAHEILTNNPHDVTLEQARTENNVLAGNIDMNNAGTIVNLPDPVNDQDAVNKRYVDGLVDGVRWKEPVVAATTAALVDTYTYNNGTLGVGATLTKTTNGAFPAQDGITLVQGDRVLIKDETAGAAPYNGIYEVTTVGDVGTPWQLTRTEDFDEADEMASAATLIMEGTALADTGWTCTTDEPITVGTTNITWIEFTRLGQITAGAGLFKSSANTIDVGDAGKGVQVNANDVQVDASEIAGDGLEQLAGGGNEHILKVDAGDSGAANLANVISVESAGISVKVDETSVQENGSGQLEVIGYQGVIAGTNVDPSSGYVLDSVPVATYWSAKWLVTARVNADTDERESWEVWALNDGTTIVDKSIYAINFVVQKIAGSAISVDVSGGNMRLILTATENIDFRVTRIAH